MRVRAFGIAMMFLLVIASLVSGISAAPTSITLNPTADDFAYFLDTLLNGESFLAIRGSSDLSGGCLSQAETFLKFDLNPVPSGYQVTDATLTLRTTASTGSMTMGLFGSYTDTWSEGTTHIVWAERPAQDVDLNSTGANAGSGNTIVFSSSSEFVNFLNQQLLNDVNKIVTIGIEAYAACSAPTVPSQQVSAKTADGGTVSPVLTLSSNPLAVMLDSFQAQTQSDGIMLSWETISEINNQGFNLYRAMEPDGEQTLLAFVPSQSPGSTQGFSYSWLDTDVVFGQTYYYWIATIDIGSGALTWYGPVSVTHLAPTAVSLVNLNVSFLSGLTSKLALPAVIILIVAMSYYRRKRNADSSPSRTRDETNLIIGDSEDKNVGRRQP